MANLESVTATLALALLAGCGAVPVVQYTKVDDTHTDVPSKVTDMYYLAQSQITIDKTKKEDPKTKLTTEEYSIVSKPVPYTAYKVGIIPENSIRVTTKVNITKIENTDLVSAIGIETTDNTVALVNQIGGVAVKVIGLFGALAPALGDKPCIPDDQFPVTLMLNSTKLAQNAITLKFNARGMEVEDGCISVEIGSRPVDAISSEPLFGKPTSNYFYSSCRDATISYEQAPGGVKKRVSKAIRIADPNVVQQVQFPYKGSVTMHSSCGVSVKTDAASPQNTISVIDALAAQLKAIVDAAKK